MGLQRESFTLLTDLYQITMAYGYWKNNRHDDEAVFHLFYRKAPFNGGYAIAAGLDTAIEFIENFSFTDSDIEYLRELSGNDGKALFPDEFLVYLHNLKLSIDIDAMPDGTLVFPHEPLLRIKGSMLQCQLLETPLLNIMNFETLVATKAARICEATKGDAVVEFGLRRAQGIDGAMTASRAAYIGGVAATSNVLAGKEYGIPVKGTHAHSWVMSFEDELEAFEEYAEAMPNNSVLLVDTYDTIGGVQKAIEIGRSLDAKGHRLAGIRLDSGDLAQLSIEARILLDEAGFEDADIVASNDLDEYAIADLKAKGAKINVWGVGTKLVTCFDQPALGGVYKLGAIKQNGEWQYKIKLSNDLIKVSNPGIQQVYRLIKKNKIVASGIGPVDLVDPEKAAWMTFDGKEKFYDDESNIQALLVPVIVNGVLKGRREKIGDARKRAAKQLDMLKPATKRNVDPCPMYQGLEEGLHSLKMELIDRHMGICV